jgi:hypothetical protein
VKDDVDHVVLARSMLMPSFRACASQLVSLSLLFYLSLSLSNSRTHTIERGCTADTWPPGGGASAASRHW